MSLTWGNVKPPRGAVLDRSHPLSRGLVGYWPFNEGTGSLVNTLVGGPAGVWNGTLGSQWGVSSRGMVGSFNGSNTYVALGTDLGFPAYQAAAGMSLSVWLIGTSTNPVGSALFVQDNTGFGQVGYSLMVSGVSASPTANLFIRNSSGTTIASLSSTAKILENGIPHHVVVVDVMGTVAFYVDGVLDSTQSYTPSALGTTINKTTLGGWVGTGVLRPYPGKMILASLYKRSLTAAEVASLYAAPYQMIAPTIPDAVFYSIGVGGSTAYTGTLAVNRVIRSALTAAGAGADALTVNRVLRSAQIAQSTAAGSATLNRVDRTAQTAGGAATDGTSINRVLRTGQTGAGAAVDALGLNRVLTLQQTAGQTFSATLAINRVLRLSPAGAQDAAGTLALNRVTRTTTTAGVAATDTTTLDRVEQLQSSGMAVSVDTLLLARFHALGAATSSVRFGPTPASRTFIVSADQRAFVVPFEDRTFTA